MTAALVLGLVASSASATVVAPLNLDALINSSDLIVMGRVDSLRSHRQGPRPGIYTDVEIAVDRYLVGAGPADLTVTIHGGRVGDRAMVVHGQAHFRQGERVLLFLTRGGGRLWPNAMAQGKWGVTRDSDGKAWAFPTAGAHAGSTAVRVVDLLDLVSRGQR